MSMTLMLNYASTEVAMPPPEVAMPPPEVAMPPSEVAMPPPEVAIHLLSPNQVPALHLLC